MTEQESESILQFPCQFPIKAMGKTSSKLDIIIEEIVRHHVKEIPEGAIQSRPSKNGNYVSITITIEATSKQQLDAIYQELSTHPDVLMAL